MAGEVELVRMPLVTLSPLEVNPTDPLTGTVTIKNNTLDSGTKVNVGFLFGTYDSDTGTFDPFTVNVGGTDCYYGTYKKDVEVPNKGNTKAVDVTTYAYPYISEETTFDILVFVGPSQKLQGMKSYYDQGGRLILIYKSDYDSYESSIYDTAVYEDQVTIAPESTVTGFSIAKA